MSTPKDPYWQKDRHLENKSYGVENSLLIYKRKCFNNNILYHLSRICFEIIKAGIKGCRETLENRIEFPINPISAVMNGVESIYQQRDRKMEINQKEENGIVSIAIKGRLDADSSAEAETVVKDALGGETSRLLFNLGELEYLSSAGLRVLLSAAKEMRRRDGKIVLCALNEFVKEIFEVSGFQSLIPITDTVESGIEVLS